MLKKAIIVVGGLFLLSGLFFGRDACSYVSTSFGRMKDAVRESVPVEFEIARAHKMLKGLGPEIRHNMHAIAKEEVELERLGEQIASLEHKLSRDKQDVLRLQADLRSGSKTFKVAGYTCGESDAKRALSHRFACYKTNDATLANLRKVQEARGRKLESSRQKLEEMLVARKNLEVELENIAAQQKMIEVAQTAAKYHFDETQLGRIKELVQSLQARLRVEERVAEMSGETFEDEPGVLSETNDDVVEEVAAYFQSAQVAADVK
jgi:hypothetical protein